MSRSWNRLARRVWPSPPGAVSLGISGDGMSALRAERSGDTYLVTHFARERLPFNPFHGAGPRSEDALAFAQAIQRLAAAVPQGHWPLQIALPDAAAIFQVLEFDSLPASERDRASLALFRLEKDWPDVAAMECATQMLGSEQGQAMLLALAVRRDWLDCLRDGCRAAGWAPRVMDITVNHLFNRFYDVICATTGDGVLISIEPDSWSIIFWDQAHRPRFVRTSVREGGEQGGHEAVAHDAERLIRAYVLAEPGRVIEKVHVCASEGDGLRLSGHLDARMRAPCVRFNATEGFATAPGAEISLHDAPLGALAAVAPRA